MAKRMQKAGHAQVACTSSRPSGLAGMKANASVGVIFGAWRSQNHPGGQRWVPKVGYPVDDLVPGIDGLGQQTTRPEVLGDGSVLEVSCVAQRASPSCGTFHERAVEMSDQLLH